MAAHVASGANVAGRLGTIGANKKPRSSFEAEVFRLQMAWR